MGCAEFPVCVACGPPGWNCPACADISQCSNCNAAYHDQCLWDDGGMSCNVCGIHLCENCRSLPIIGGFTCCFEDCENDMCLACAAQDRQVVCEQGHTSCISCVGECIRSCAFMETEFRGIIVDVDRRCFECWSEAFARLKGFDDYGHFSMSMYRIPVEIKQIGDIFAGAAQWWFLGGGQHQDTKKFNACSALWSQLESVSEGLFNDTAPLSVTEILSQLTLTSVTVWERSLSMELMPHSPSSTQKTTLRPSLQSPRLMSLATMVSRPSAPCILTMTTASALPQFTCVLAKSSTI